jgi:hypothetical protein
MVWAMTELKILNWHGPNDPTDNTAVPYTTTPLPNSAVVPYEDSYFT